MSDNMVDVVETKTVVVYSIGIARAKLLERIAMYVFHGDNRCGTLNMEQLKQTARIMGLQPHPEDYTDEVVAKIDPRDGERTMSIERKYNDNRDFGQEDPISHTRSC